jgi:hypothetical protein
MLPGYTIWWRTRFRTSTRWRFLNRPFEERLEATGQEMVGCVPDIARYFRITDHLGMVPPGLDPVVGGKGAGVDHRYRARQRGLEELRVPRRHGSASRPC